MKRLFIAFKIHPDQGFLTTFRDLRNAMARQQIKWVDERIIHITLKFLGDTEEKTIPAISGILDKRAMQTHALEIRLKGLGIFGSRYDPRVVWTGIEPWDALASLMKSLREDLIPVGFEPDRQNLVPHLTLGRIRELRDKESFNETLEKYKSVSSVPVLLQEMILYESILHREGPEYIKIRTFQLKDG
jgi:2'-5' RNA ligase